MDRTAVVWVEGRGGTGTRLKLALGSEFRCRGQHGRALLDRTAEGGRPYILFPVIPRRSCD